MLAIKVPEAKLGSAFGAEKYPSLYVNINALTVSMTGHYKYNEDIISHILYVTTKHNEMYLFIIIMIYVTKWPCE